MTMQNQTNPDAVRSASCSPSFFFVFDVESIGLHGEAFAVAGGVYSAADGAAQNEFAFACSPDIAVGEFSDRKWVMENVPPILVTHRNPRLVRAEFFQEWIAAKQRYPGIQMAAECLWPVEARFMCLCISDGAGRNWDGPYPFVEISSVMMAAGMDPMVTYERTPSEMPAHNPLGDARQSARLLATALRMVNANLSGEVRT